MNKTTILMTACINPKGVTFVKIDNCNERFKQYIVSIIYWIINSNVNNIVFCDNSNYKFDYSFLYKLADMHNKILEVIIFDGNKESKLYGKGYGEGEIIKYSIMNSELLSQSTEFYKATGRVFIKNFDRIKKVHCNDDNIFIKSKINSKLIDTRFFKCNKEFYKKNLLDVYKEVDDINGVYLEHKYYECLYKVRNNIICFKEYPIIIGKSGSTNMDYDESLFKVTLKNILIKIGKYNI